MLPSVINNCIYDKTFGLTSYLHDSNQYALLKYTTNTFGLLEVRISFLFMTV